MPMQAAAYVLNTGLCFMADTEACNYMSELILQSAIPIISDSLSFRLPKQSYNYHDRFIFC